jgi:hypothetical protein
LKTGEKDSASKLDNLKKENERISALLAKKTKESGDLDKWKSRYYDLEIKLN